MVYTCGKVLLVFFAHVYETDRDLGGRGRNRGPGGLGWSSHDSGVTRK